MVVLDIVRDLLCRGEESFDDGETGYDREPPAAMRGRTDRYASAARGTVRSRIILFAPGGLDQTEEIVTSLQRGNSVILNLERMHREAARRLLDFVSGFSYSHANQIRRVALSTYMIVPYDVTIRVMENGYADRLRAYRPYTSG